MEDSDWRDVIDNNLNGAANTIRAFAPKMVAQEARHERCLQLFGLQIGLGLMKSAALELGHIGITVNAVIPGLVDTALTRYEKRLSESVGDKAARRKPNSARGVGHPGRDGPVAGRLAAAR